MYVYEFEIGANQPRIMQVLFEVQSKKGEGMIEVNL
jgi:hypothetical protein